MSGNYTCPLRLGTDTGSRFYWTMAMDFPSGPFVDMKHLLKTHKDARRRLFGRMKLHIQ